MNPETQGKLMVAMLVSILAFGTGTGTVLVTGLNHNQNALNFINNTKQSELPVIPNMNQNRQNIYDQNTEQNDQFTGETNGQSNGQTNTNNNNNPSNNNNNTTN